MFHFYWFLCYSLAMVFKYKSAREYLKAVLSRKKEKNSSFSLRAFAKQLDLSPSIISDFFNRKKSLSFHSAMKIAAKLHLSPQAAEFFTTLVLIDASSSEGEKNLLLAKLKILQPDKNQKYVDEIHSLLAESKTLSSHHYIMEGSLKQRVLIRLEDRLTGKPIQAFYDHFSNPASFVASDSYFLPNADGSFRAYLAETSLPSGTPALLHADNLTLKVTFDNENFPTIRNIYMKELASGRLSVGELIFSKQRVLQRCFFPDTEKEFVWEYLAK